MVELIPHGVYLLDGQTIVDNPEGLPAKDEARENTIAYGILRAHDVDSSTGAGTGKKQFRIHFDAMASHDITYVGIIQTARASGLETFPIPYAMTNCHNSLCAVGGTINEDDHVFGLSAAKKYGGIYVPANQAVIHQYVREALATCGGMVLGSDSHTRYGSLGCMGVGEGGGELVKQLLHNTWDINAPEVVLVWLEGKPKHGVGPHDVAISLVKATFESGFVKNKVLEFAGPGVKELPIDFRNGIDVMTTETTCLSSIWITDEKVKEHYETHRRPEAFKELKPGKVAWYDSVIRVDLSTQESMIALPFHPSNAFTIHELQADPEGILKAVEEDARKRFGDKVQIDLLSKIVDGKVRADQALIAGCSGGTYDNLAEAASIMKGKTIGMTLYNGMKDFSGIVESVLNKVIVPLLPLFICGTFVDMTRSGKTFTILGILWKVFLTVIAMHLIFIVLQFIVAGAFSGKNPFTLIKNQIPGYTTALGTQSSAATIPVNLQCAEADGVSEQIRNFVVPLCANIHMCGSMITITACATAVCLMNQLPISLGTVIPFIMTLGVAMVASPGAPGGSIMTALPFLYMIFGAEAGDPNGPICAIMVALYITQDSFGTACNVSGDNAIGVIVNKIYEKWIKKD